MLLTDSTFSFSFVATPVSMIDREPRPPMFPVTPTEPSWASNLLPHLSAIFENTQDAIWSVDTERQLVVYNSFFEQRIRSWWNLEVAPGMRHGGRKGAEAEFWNDIYTRVLHGKPVVAQREYKRAEGDAFVEFSLNPIWNSEAIIVGAAGIGRDVTHIRELDAETRRREAAYRHLLDSTTDFIWSIDREYRFTNFNSPLQATVRKTLNTELAVGMSYLNLVEQHADFWRTSYDRVFAGELLTVERSFTTAHGSGTVEFSLSPMRDADGRVVGVSGVGRDVTRVRELSNEIRLRETTYRQVLDSSIDAIWSIDTAYRFTSFNAFLFKILKLATGQEIAVGMYHLTVGEPDEGEFWKGAYDRAFAGEQFKIEREYSNAAGYAIVEFSLNPIWEGNQIIGVSGVGRDITPLRTLAHALETSEKAYRLLFLDSPLPMWTVDLETLRFAQFNRATLQLYGYTEEEFQELTLLDVHPERDREYFANQILKDIKADPDERHKHSQHHRKNGKIIDVEIYSHYYEFEGRPSRLTLIKDISKQRRAETRLVEANERFRLAADAVTSVIWDWNARTDHVECFGPLERVIGFNAASLGSQSIRFWIERIHPEDRWPVARNLIRSLQGGSHFELECRLRRRDGHYSYIWTKGTIVRSGAGVPIRIVGSSLDITERKRMELELEHERETAILARERAEEMSRLKSNFLANMSHEIRTPLTAILGFAELLSEDLDDPEKRLQASIIQASGTRLLETINHILDLARIEAGKIELHLAEHSVLRAMEESVTLLRPLAETKGLRLVISDNATDIKARIDILYFHQILTNLIGNAIKFTSSGTITISTWDCHNPEDADCLKTTQSEERTVIGTVPCPCIAIEVADEGVGISKEFLPRIFDEFKQESAGYDRNYEGTGIGLTITAKLVEMMHGSITVISKLGEGSRFIVQLPL